MYDKPGCFGHAVTYNATSSHCQNCWAADDCSKAARARLEELKPILNVDAVIRMSHKKAPAEQRFDADLSPTMQKVIASLPEEAQRTAARLLRMKLNFRKILLEGVNPIENQKPVAVSVLFGMLLKGPVERDSYLSFLRDAVGHSPSIALSEAAIGISIVTGLGIAVYQGDKLILKKDTK